MVYQNHQSGNHAEALAEAFLQENGLTTREKNYAAHDIGEIDLIMQDGAYCVFIEVRARTKADHGHPLESISNSKQKRIVRTAKHYLMKYDLWEKIDCRFDAVGIVFGEPPIWVQNAFEC